MQYDYTFTPYAQRPVCLSDVSQLSMDLVASAAYLTAMKRQALDTSGADHSEIVKQIFWETAQEFMDTLPPIGKALLYQYVIDLFSDQPNLPAERLPDGQEAFTRLQQAYQHVYGQPLPRVLTPRSTRESVYNFLLSHLLTAKFQQALPRQSNASELVIT